VSFRSFLDPRSPALPIGRFSEGGLAKEECDTLRQVPSGTWLRFFHPAKREVRTHYIASGYAQERELLIKLIYA